MYISTEDMIGIIIFLIALVGSLCSIVYPIPYDINTHQVTLTEKISNSYVTMTSSENIGIINLGGGESETKINFINENGKVVSLKVKNEGDIYYKKGKENKIVYKETKTHNLFGFNKQSEITKVTIYKK